MKTMLVVLALALALAGCGKFSDLIETNAQGYTMRCIDGTQYVLLTSDRGLAITPHVGVDGLPKGCAK